jgi:hypothetical protein
MHQVSSPTNRISAAMQHEDGVALDFALARNPHEVGLYAEPHAGIVQTTSGSEVRRLTGRTMKAKSMQCVCVVAKDVEHAAAPSPADQADRQRSLEQRNAKHARDMRPALTLVETRTAVDAPATARAIKLNAGGMQRSPTRLSHRGAIDSQIHDA